jgi:hypothetical protein
MFIFRIIAGLFKFCMNLWNLIITGIGIAVIWGLIENALNK